MNQPTEKPPQVFLVSIRIVGANAGDCRRFAKLIADEVEAQFETLAEAGMEKDRPPIRGPLHYELNLSKWEPIP